MHHFCNQLKAINSHSHIDHLVREACSLVLIMGVAFYGNLHEVEVDSMLKVQ